MKKIRNLLLAGLVVIGFAACNNEEIVGGQDKENPLAGYLTLEFKSPAMNGTRTTEHDGREPGSETENEISNVTVVITDDGGKIQQVYEKIEIATLTTTKKIEVDPITGAKVYALINADGITLDGVAAGASIDQVIQAASADVITKGFNNGSFFMTNSQSAIDKTYLDAGAPLTIAAGETVNVPITVDRLAAKVVDKTNYESNQPDMSKLPADATALFDRVVVTGFVPLNINPEMNLFQKWGTANEDGMSLTGNVLQTPRTLSKFLLGLDTYRETKTENGILIGLTDKTTDADFVDSVYVTENRPTITKESTIGSGADAKTILNATVGETTAVIYQVKAMKGADNTGTFYRYNGNLYGDKAAIDKVLEPLVDASGFTTPEQYRENGVQVYENGIMYYTYYIKDPNTNYQVDGKDYFGVFRNSIYKLKINSISNVGDDVPGNSTSPEDPVVQEEAYLTVEVTVNDWVLNEIKIDF